MTGPEPRIELADPQRQLLDEIADPKMKRRDIAQTYLLALYSGRAVDWRRVNQAIIDRWSPYALGWIKREVWR